MAGRVFQHFQTGLQFCCCSKKHHVICNVPWIVIQLLWPKKAKKKHPHIGKYFSINHSCKFGETCYYKHITSKRNNDTIYLVIKMADMTDSYEMIETFFYHFAGSFAKTRAINGLTYTSDCVVSILANLDPLKSYQTVIPISLIYHKLA